MDFITSFLKVDGKDMNKFSMYAMFVATQKACKAETIAELFLKHIVKYFGLPEEIVSNPDVIFTSQFWTLLFSMMGSELKFSIANHPQTNG